MMFGLMVTWWPAAPSGEPDHVLEAINSFFRGDHRLDRLDPGGQDSPICAVAAGFVEVADVNHFTSHLMNAVEPLLKNGWLQASYLDLAYRGSGSRGWQPLALPA
jgi:hypothetical protein